MINCVHDRTYWIADCHMCARCNQVIAIATPVKEEKVTHLSSTYIAHKLVTLEAQLDRYEVIGSIKGMRNLIDTLRAFTERDNNDLDTMGIVGIRAHRNNIREALRELDTLKETQ